MKKYYTLLVLFAAIALLPVACKKDEVKSIYTGGNTPALSASATNLDMVPADSSANVITFSWSNPDYKLLEGATTLDVTYTIEIDSAGKQFASAEEITVTNNLSAPLSGKAFNKILSDLGYTDSSKAYSLDVRLKASLYVAGTLLTSNTISLLASPYSTKPTAMYPVPAELFLVGDATAGGWDNPVPVPSQKFAKLDEFTFGGIFQLTGGLKYLFIPINGGWDHKYAIVDPDVPGASAGGDFIVDAGKDIPAPATSGLYKIIVNFVTGKYAVTEVTGAADIPPANLYIVGDATPGGWDNPVPEPSQRFTQVSGGGFEIVIPLAANLKYLFLPENGSWDHKYAIANASAPGAKQGGTFVADTGQDIPSPDEAGTYKIEVEFINKTYKVTKQ